MQTIMQGPEQAAEWVIENIAIEAESEGVPLTADERDRLRWDAARMARASDVDRRVFIALNNRVVALIRRAIERAKAQGATTIRVRRGLKIPTDWFAAYEHIHTSNLPWAISGVLQNAVNSNPFAGESSPWKSR